MGCGATKLEPTEEPAPEGQSDKMKFRQATVIDLLAAENEENDRILLKWAGKVFDQFDADHNGRLDSKELASALKKLPKTRPVNLPPDTKMMTVEQLITTLDSDGDGTVSKAEWIANLNKCVGLAHCLSDNVDENGELKNFSEDIGS